MNIDLYIHLYNYTDCRLGDRTVQTYTLKFASYGAERYGSLYVLYNFAYEVVKRIYIISVAF